MKTQPTPKQRVIIVLVSAHGMSADLAAYSHESKELNTYLQQGYIVKEIIPQSAALIIAVTFLLEKPGEPEIPDSPS